MASKVKASRREPRGTSAVARGTLIEMSAAGSYLDWSTLTQCGLKLSEHDRRGNTPAAADHALQAR